MLCQRLQIVNYHLNQLKLSEVVDNLSIFCRILFDSKLNYHSDISFTYFCI